MNGKTFSVEVAESGELGNIVPNPPSAPALDPPVIGGELVTAALAGNIIKVLVKVGDTVEEGQIMLILEAMKMETEVSAPTHALISVVHVQEGDAVSVGDSLVSYS